MTTIKFSNGWVIEAQNVVETEDRIRGFVRDGMHFMDYDKVNHIYNAVARRFFLAENPAPEIEWDRPIAIHNDVFLIE